MTKTEIGDIEHAGPGWQVVLARSESGAFEDCRAYRDFLGIQGDIMKLEPRTRIVRFLRGEGFAVARRFVLKTYLNPHITGLGRPGRPSKAEREFCNLRRCGALGVPVVEPVAFGACSPFPGLYRSSFLVTRYRESAEDLRSWLRARRRWMTADDLALVAILGGLGRMFRRLHDAGVVLGSANLRNVLLDVETVRIGDPKLTLLDLPERIVSHRRRACERDLGALVGPLLRILPVAVLKPLLHAYAPSLPAPELADLERRVAWAARVHNNLTPLSRLRKRVHKSWMWVIRGGRRARDVRVRETGKPANERGAIPLDRV